MRLKLVVPGLCGPLPEVDSLQDNVSCRAFAKTLSRGDRFFNTVTGFEAELAALYGMNVSEAVPSAVLSLMGSGRALGSGFWFHADPVNLQADMDHAVLRDSNLLNIQQQEADSLTSVVNEHFSSDGIQLIAVDTNHWYLNIAGHEAVSTTPLHNAIGRNVKFIMPTGKDESYWNSFMNEVQMLFHMNTVNQNREHAGQLAINGLWLWGGGELPKYRKTQLQQVFSNHVLAKGLAKYHDIACDPINNINSLLNSIEQNKSTLIVLDEMFSVTCYGDTTSWQDMMVDMYKQWVMPLLDFAFSQGLSVDLHPCNGTHYLISAKNKYRIFRRGDIKQHVGTYD